MKFIRFLLIPFSLLYGLVITIRNYLYDSKLIKSTSFKKPLILVGNLSVGGTGKTPLVEHLIEKFQHSHKVVVLSRGYKRKSKGFVLANKKTTIWDIGDEPYQYFKKFKNIQVCVDSNRTRAIITMLQQNPSPDLFILDDGFQHRKISPTLSIVCTPYYNLYKDDYLLPVGRLREYRRGIKRAQIVVVTKCPQNLSIKAQIAIKKKLNLCNYQRLFFSYIEYGNELIGHEKITINSLKNKNVLLVTGIANPSPLVQFLESNHLTFSHLKYADHHPFTEKNIATIKRKFKQLPSPKRIVTTEKDFVRLQNQLKELCYLPIRVKFVGDQKKWDTCIQEAIIH